MQKLLCQINDVGFTTKPTDIRFYGALRDKMIQKPWSYISEDEFVDKVTRKGFAFYGNLFDGHDLMETGQQRKCWRAQTIVGVDIDKTTADPQMMCHFYTELGLMPWMAYSTFSDGKDGLRSYRILWRVEVDHSISYEQWADVIKALSTKTELGDKHARDCTRMWQGGLKGPCWHVPNSMPWTYGELSSKLGLR
jgi:hypothetical protein